MRVSPRQMEEFEKVVTYIRNKKLKAYTFIFQVCKSQNRKDIIDNNCTAPSNINKKEIEKKDEHIKH